MQFNRGKMGEAVRTFEDPKTGEIREDRRKPENNNNDARRKERRITAGVISVATIATIGALIIGNKLAKGEPAPINTVETPACATSPKAELGDTKWSLAREVYPNLDALATEKVSVESTSRDGILRPGDTVEVCVPLEDVALANKAE